jgi:hypothetical protein
LVVTFVLGGGWFGSPQKARAGGLIITVETTAATVDSGDNLCSLPEAIQAANANAVVGNCEGSGDDLIEFSLPNPSMILLTTTQLDTITDTVEIDGALAGGGKVELKGEPPNGAFVIGDSISDTAAGSAIRNLVMNGFGWAITVNDSGATLTGNYLGTNVAGTSAVPNDTGIVAITADNLQIGGTNDVTPGGPCTGECNLISGNYQGIVIIAGTGIVIQGNYIGTNAAGTAAIPNTVDGIYDKVGVTIGGASVGAGNVISGNGASGILTQEAPQIYGNRIGTNAAGTAAIPNGGPGINAGSVTGGAIGGDVDGEGNVISGNSGVGIDLSATSSVSIFANMIGTGANGVTPVPNGSHGLLIQAGGGESENNLVGGGLDSANIIAFNGGDGVRVDGGSPNPGSARYNRILGNSIHDNAGKGIELVNGGNMEIAPPTITSADVNSASGTACSLCGIDIFSDDADEGETYHGDVGAEADGSWTGSGPFTGQNVTVTNTDANGNTSEFSEPFSIPTPTPSPSPTPSPTSSPTPTVTPSGTPSGTPTGEEFAWGDHDCSGTPDEGDGLIGLAQAAGLETDTGDCFEMGEAVDVANASVHDWGDVDCSGVIDALDALEVFAYAAGIEESQPGSCPDIGEERVVEPV